jgi:RND superfamily putative drug exporter
VCGRRSKYLVVAFWILAVALLGSLAGTLQADEVTIFKGIDSTLLYATLAVVIVLLLVTYRSPVLWLLPVISAGVALTAAQAVIYLLTQHANLTVNRQSEDILFVLVIGASTDYALLLIARYREELRRHADRHEAMAVALHRVGPAIIASALTVAVGMLCLLAAESGDISGLGPVAATGIGVGLIAMTTLLPAMLVIFGRRPRTVWEGTATALTLDTGRHIWWPGWLAKSPAPPGRSALTGGT